MGITLTRGPRWERRKESRPAELLAAALDLFVERGYAATRLEEVAARAGVSKGTLYLYYDSKAELFKAVVRETIVPQLDELRNAVDRPGRPSAEVLEGFFQEWWRRFGTTRAAGIAKLIIAEAGNFPEVASFFQQEVIEPHMRLLISIIDQGVQRGEFVPVDKRAAAHAWIAPLVLKTIWAHSIETQCRPEDRLDPARLLRTHIDLVLASLRPPAARKVEA